MISRPAVRHRRLALAIALIGVVFTQHVAAAPPRSPAESLGRLLETPLDIHLEHVPMRDALRLLSAAIETPILLREDPAGGFSGDVPITMMLNEPTTAMDALEMLLDITALGEDATWQLRTGFIEVGTKRVLARVGLIETQLYDITDFRLEPSYTQSDMARQGGPSVPGEIIDCAPFHHHKYRAAHVAERTPVDNGCAICRRKTSNEVVLELMRLIVGVIEPGNWNLPDDFDDLSNVALGPNMPAQLPTHASRDPIKAVGRLRLEEGRSLAVRAPDFMRRAIGGYPDPVKPAPLTEGVVEKRTARATSGSSFIKPLIATPDSAKMEQPRRFGSFVERVVAMPPTHGAILSRLQEATVTINVNERPLREVIELWGMQANVPVLGRFLDDPVGHGLDPDHPISLAVENESAIETLDLILGESTGFDGSATWQIRHGFVEVGTKARLSVPAAREIRLYSIGDIRLINRAGSPTELRGRSKMRPTREAEALDVLANVVERIEPETWDFGQPLIDEGAKRPIPEMPIDASPPPQAPQPVYQPLQKIASIRVYRDFLVVNAPDYYHRLIGGYRGDSVSDPGD